jgi:hypothetical protein
MERRRTDRSGDLTEQEKRMMNTHRTAAFVFALAATGLGLGAGFARAGTSTVDFQSDTSLHQLGSFAGSMTYDDATHQLTITLDNTSSGNGKLTGFAFDINGSDAAKLEKVKRDPWKDDRNKKGIAVAKPFGNYEAGAGLGGKFGAAGGKGIAAGASKTFVFDVTGPDAGTLSASAFLSGGPANREIVASFAGFKTGKTDRVGGALLVSSTTNNNTDNNTTDTSGDTGALSGTQSNLGGDDNGNGTGTPLGGPGGDKTSAGGSNATAVPLPSAASSGLAALGLLGLVALLKRRAGRLTA